MFHPFFIIVFAVMTNASLSSVDQTEDMYILLSSVSELQEPKPCIFYQFDSKKGELTKLKELNYKLGVRRIEYYQEPNKIIILGRSKNNIMQVRIIMPDDLSQEEIYEVPYEFIQGSYYLNDELDPGMVIYGRARLADKTTTMSKVSESTKRISNINAGQTRWDKMLMNGSSENRSWNTLLINLSVDLDGSIKPLNNEILSMNNITLDEKSSAIYRNTPSRGLSVFCSDDRQMLIRDFARKDSYREAMFYVYNHKLKTWSTFSGTGSYDCPQMFKNWWVIQEVKEHPQYNLISTNKFAFVNRDNLEQFVWHKTRDTEVLGIWGAQLIYRIKDELYSAQIENDKITGDKLMIKDPRITNVHWIFPKEAK